MNSVPERIYKVALAYLEKAKGRLSEIDSAAEEELRRSLPREYLADDFNAGAVDDPMARAAAKINAAREQTAARREVTPERYNFSTQATNTPPAVADPVRTAYRVVGVPDGSDYPTVEKAVLKLRERCNPSRFPEGSTERQEAEKILERVERAFAVLQNALGVETSRFDRLEL